MGAQGPFANKQQVLALDLKQPANVIIISGTAGYKLSRPYTAESVAMRLDSFLGVAGLGSRQALVGAVTECESGTKPEARRVPPE
jgi:hypothetical protein